MIYQIFYIVMLISYAGLGIMSPTIRLRVIGLLLVVVNGLIFWRVK